MGEGIQRTNRYYGLDALRGVAAVAVVCLHVGSGLHGLPIPGSGALAVDLFFLLSGFVIASAYEERLASNLTPWGFIRIRLIRLYPLYLLGLMLGGAKLFVQIFVGSNPPAAGDLAIDFAAGLFMLPSPTTLGLKGGVLFPLNGAAWSLFFEMAVNILYAVIARWLTGRILVALVVAAGFALCWAVADNGSVLMGNTWHSLVYGVPRTAFPFFLGVLLYRARWPSRLPRLGAGSLLAALAALLFFLFYDPRGARPVYDLMCVGLAFPALVLFASRIEASGWARIFSKASGDISYAVYIVHMPLAGILFAVLKRVAPNLQNTIGAGPTFVVSLMVACYIIDRVYDGPVRRFLTAHLSGRVRAAPSVPASVSAE